ncbi:ribonuclease-like [Gopherus flavomarginatus]|uniref:ribonuclease-like n=1 Tax=Gopherus flavomarginatus TaxID=286002 RepID=UPI0021CC2BB6|nr:ribonuclease-like [Gopherus flavomarginatus]
MAPKGPRPLLFLTLVLLAACLAQLSEGASYRQFLNRHVDFPKSGGGNNRLYCNRIMQRRGLTHPVCKPTNTFIHAPTSQVQAICRGAGRCHGRNFCDSNSSFHLTTCRVAPGSRPGRCVYRGRVQTRRIRVACNQRLPVHFSRIL